MEFGIMEFGPSTPSALEKKEVALPFFFFPSFTSDSNFQIASAFEAQKS